jgi:hypothetical protein
MLTSTASKTLVKEYSTSKRYKEDQIHLFPSVQKSESEKISNNKKEPKNLSTNEASISELDELGELIKYQEDNLPVPLSKKDDESYKILKIKQLKRLTMPPNKSCRKFPEEIEPLYVKEFKIHNAFSAIKKRKPVHSTRRIYSSNFTLYKTNGGIERFMIFRDKDVGIYEYWQAHIHETHNDEDVETDDEQKTLAQNYSISEIKEGLEYIAKYGDGAFVNLNRYGYLLGKNKVKQIMEEIEYDLEGIILNKNDKTNRSSYL